MANIKDMRNRANRRQIVTGHIIYVVLTFLYTMYLYFVFNLIYTDTITAEYAMFNFGVMQLGIHHIFIIASLIIHLLLYYYPKKIVAFIIELCWVIAIVWLIVCSFGIAFEDNIPNIMHRLLIIIPLILGVVYLLRLIVMMHREYFSYHRTKF